MIQDEHSLLLNKSRSLLGWDLIRETLASLTFSPVTHALCLELLPEDSPKSAEQSIEETAEMLALLESVESPPMDNFENVELILQDASERFLIDPIQGLHVMKLLRLVRAWKRYFEKKINAPILKGKSEWLEPLLPLLKELERCIDDDGEIKENASPELRQAIRDVWTTKEKVEGMVTKLFSDASYVEALQDSYHTERDGRLVLPIKSEWRTRVDGIVHDTSGSGATVYMEPTKLVQWNNQLKLCRIRVEREKIKILGHLAREILEGREFLRRNLETLAELDMVHAKARLARRMQARKCPINLNGRVTLLQARNPELILNSREVVPNDVLWEPDVRVIIISGPNTGGKTVTLKTVGLMSLMVRAGLLLPVGADSTMAFFPEVYADIGDDQNIQLNLSTFSAHLRKIIHIIENAVPGGLVLLDELGIATDPHEGAALAEAILMEMKTKGLTTIVSTHYLSLKILGQTQAGFLNACTEFDTQSLTPTYRLVFGVPGNSAALEIGERLGLSQKIISHAREIHKARDNEANALLQDLNRQLLKVAQDKELIEQQEIEIRKLREEQAQITQTLRREMSDFEDKKTHQLQTFVREGKNEIRKLIEEAKGTQSMQTLRKIQAQIETKGKAPLVSPKDMEGWDVPPDRLKKGDRVMVDTYGKTGILQEDPGGKKKVRVQMGNISTLVETDKLRGNLGANADKEKTESAEVRVHVEPRSQMQVTCDLRGLRWEEAENAMESFIGQALANKVGRAKIIHGHGMGALKKLVRDYLETTGIAKSFAPGSQGDGGDGVTIVEFD
jgi:DNA mismatch repair protein MutS2